MFFKVGTRIYGNGYAVPVDESGNEIELSVPTSDLLIHYDIGDVNGWDATNGIIKNIAPTANPTIADMVVQGGNAITTNGFVAFDGVSTYAESQGNISEIWNYMNLNATKSFTLYGSFYSSARESVGLSFGKFGSFDLFQRTSSDSPNAKFGLTDIWDDGDDKDFVNFYPTVGDFGAQENEWFQAGLRVTYDEASGDSKIEFLYNGKSMETWLNEYSGPYWETGSPAEFGPARYAWNIGTSKTVKLDWYVEPTSWKAAPMRIGRHPYLNYYAPNVVSYYMHYGRALTDAELLEVHNYHQVRFE